MIMLVLYVTLKHILFIKMYTFGRDTTIWISGIWGCKKNLNIEKITFKIVQMTFLDMHFTNQKLSFDIYGRKFTSWNMFFT